MAQNTTELSAERPLAEEILSGKNGKESGHEAEPAQKMALAPLVDKIAWGIARGLVVAMKELENHIAAETRKVGDSVGRRLDTLQASIQELAGAAAEQRSFNTSIQERCDALAASVTEQIAAAETSATEQIAAATVPLKDAAARQQEALASLRTETETLATSVTEQIAAATVPLKQADAHQQEELASLRTTTAEISAAISERVDALCRELNVHQEDIATIQTTLGGFSATVEGLAARLDRQAEALRTMSAAYSQRETELESLVEGLARLRAYPAPAPIDRL